jgi:hypothetical protein
MTVAAALLVARLVLATVIVSGVGYQLATAARLGLRLARG